MSLDVASLKLIHHCKCHHLNTKCQRLPGRAESEICFLYKTSFQHKTNKQQKAKVGISDSWYVFYLSIKFVFLIIMRLFTVSGFNFLICIWFYSISLSFLTFRWWIYDKGHKVEDEKTAMPSQLTLNFICVARQKRIADAFAAWPSASA